MAQLFECNISDITENSEINATVGWDSLSHINLMMALTKEGVPLSPIEIPEITNYKAIKEYINNSGFEVDSD